jgi:WD40 repeat protein
MTLAQTDTYDLGAQMMSPLLARAEQKLAANITAVATIGGSSDKACAAFALGDGTVRLRDIEGPEGSPSIGASERVAARHDGAATELAPLLRGFVSAGQDGRVIRCPAAGESASPLFAFGGHWVDALAVHEPSGCIAAAAERHLIVIDQQGHLQFETDAFPSSISGLSFAPEGRRVAAAHLDGLSILSLDGGAPEHRLAWKGSHIGVNWSPDGRYVVSATQERELHVWDLVTLQDHRLGGYPRKVHGMQWLAKGPFLICTGADVITAWSFAEAGPGGRPPIEIGYAYDGLVTAVAANPMRALVAGGYSNGSLLIGGVTKGEALLARGSQGDPITALSWFPNGQRLIAGTAAGNAIVVDVPKDLSIR